MTLDVFGVPGHVFARSGDGDPSSTLRDEIVVRSTTADVLVVARWQAVQ